MCIALLLIKTKTKQNKLKQNKTLNSLKCLVRFHRSCLVLPPTPFLPRLLPWGTSGTKPHKQIIAFHSSVPFLALFLFLKIVTPSVSHLQPFTILLPFKAKLKVISLMVPWMMELFTCRVSTVLQSPLSAREVHC